MTEKKFENLPWIEKYRPKSLDQIVGHDIKISILENLISDGKLPHLLFYGPPGNGKTSTILACAYRMYGDSYCKYIKELNASDERGIDVIRENIKAFIKISSSRIKLVILDEADALTMDAQNALKRIIETFSLNCRFCLICNDINKIIQGLQSRCTKFNFGMINIHNGISKINEICKLENITIDNIAIKYLIDKSGGDFRTILNTLQCMNMLMQTITIESIDKYLGLPPDDIVLDIIKNLQTLPIVDASEYILDIYRDNLWDLKYIISRISYFIVRADNISDIQKINVIEKLVDIDYKFSMLHDIEIQLYSLVGALHL